MPPLLTNKLQILKHTSVGREAGLDQDGGEATTKPVSGSQQGGGSSDMQSPCD